MKKYTTCDIDNITNDNGFHTCVCNNELNGDYEFGVDTIQVSLEEDLDYFGEFFGNDENGYEFKFYTKL